MEVGRRGFLKGLAGAAAGALILPPTLEENVEASRRYWPGWRERAQSYETIGGLDIFNRSGQPLETYVLTMTNYIDALDAWAAFPFQVEVTERMMLHLVEAAERGNVLAAGTILDEYWGPG